MFGNQLPFTPEGRKVTQRRWDSIDKKGAPYIYASTYCFPTGQPLQFDLNMPFQVFQTKDRLDFVFEEYHGLRQISLDPSKAPSPGYMGPSVAHWDGNTLVVETKGFKEGFWITGHGSSASKDAKLTQRIRKVKTQRVQLRATDRRQRRIGCQLDSGATALTRSAERTQVKRTARDRMLSGIIASIR